MDLRAKLNKVNSAIERVFKISSGKIFKGKKNLGTLDNMVLKRRLLKLFLSKRITSEIKEKQRGEFLSSCKTTCPSLQIRAL